MEKETIRILNRLVINYLSIIGLSEDESVMQKTNPIYTYINNNNVFFNDLNSMVEESMLSLDNGRSSFLEKYYQNDEIDDNIVYNIVKETYRIFNKINDIKTHQNDQIKEVILTMLGNETVYNRYIEDIFNQYKNTFFQFVENFDTDNKNFNDIKIDILTEKMLLLAKEELYLEADNLKEKINLLKTKI